VTLPRAGRPTPIRPHLSPGFIRRATPLRQRLRLQNRARLIRQTQLNPLRRLPPSRRAHPIEPRALRHEADAAAAPPPARAEAEVSEPETAKPVLLVYYPHGSRRGEATARSLAARIGSVVTSSDIKAPTSLPDDAMIVFSEERNHEFARMIGKSLGDSGYRWRFEKIPSLVGSHRNMIEVWLPMK
jgi:hypothetical protein